MLRAIGVSAVAFCTFFITPVNASFDRPVDVREVASASWDVVEIAEQLAASAGAQGETELARGAETLRRDAFAWYTAVRQLGAQAVPADSIPAVPVTMSEAYDELRGQIDDGEGLGSAELRTLWRIAQSRMAAATAAPVNVK